MACRSLSAKLLLTATLALFAMIALIFGAREAIAYYRPALLTQRMLAHTTAHVVEGLRFDANRGLLSVKVEPGLQRVFDALPSDVSYRIADKDGDVLLSSDGSDDVLSPDGMSFAPWRRTFQQERRGLVLHVLTVPVELGGAHRYLQVARSERFDAALLENESSAERDSALAAGILAMLVFGAVVLYTVRRMLKPVRRASDAAARIDPHNLAARLDVSGIPAEILPLVASFNAVLERLERGYRAQQEFLAAAAHELKTPIALMRGQIELDRLSNSEVLLKDLDHMARHVHQLLHLAEASEVQSYSRETIDVATVVTDAVDHLARLSEGRKVSVTVELPLAAVRVVAHRGAVFVLIRNLVENAIHHSSPSSVVGVRIEASGIVVRDEGHGIAPEDLPKLFDRFWRGAHRRDDGAGLGLSICREIARAHDWTLSVENATRGAEFKVLFTSPDAEPGAALERRPGVLPRFMGWRWRWAPHPSSPRRAYGDAGGTRRERRRTCPTRSGRSCSSAAAHSRGHRRTRRL
jgi:two-component system sensor histidine kinase QseC